MPLSAAEYYNPGFYASLTEKPIVIQHVQQEDCEALLPNDAPEPLASRRLGFVGIAASGRPVAVSVLYRDDLFRVLIRKPGEPAPKNATLLPHLFTAVANVYYRRVDPTQIGIHLIK